MGQLTARMAAGRRQARTRLAGLGRLRPTALAARVTALEDEVQECRQLNLRLAELTDLVQELLLPVAQRDETRVAELVERYQRGL